MRISTALKKIRTLKNELSRLIAIRKKNFYVIIPKNVSIEDADIEIRFNEITDRIDKTLNEIAILRERLLRTNINTYVEIDGEKVSLSLLKLLVDNVRSELAQIQSIKNSGYSFTSRQRRISTTDDEEKEVAQLNDLELENKVKELEKQKLALEKKLEYKNATTKLVS
ncbi:MAG: hypothetical protein GF329_04250 [Candidatus Lokiarchaeota archaeon]|nr:hypothetical protein [Candidatus Lokiarchaeota archaeon]